MLGDGSGVTSEAAKEGFRGSRWSFAGNGGGGGVREGFKADFSPIAKAGVEPLVTERGRGGRGEGKGGVTFIADLIVPFRSLRRIDEDLGGPNTSSSVIELRLVMLASKLGLKL